MNILERIKLRLKDEEISDELLNELVATSIDRLTLRLEVEQVPQKFNSIIVDIAIKMYRKLYFEGISSENVEGISTNFVDDILAEYRDEIDSYKRTIKQAKVKFI